MASCSVWKGLTWMVSCLWREFAAGDKLTLISITLSFCPWAYVLCTWGDEMLRLERREPGSWIWAGGGGLERQSQRITHLICFLQQTFLRNRKTAMISDFPNFFKWNFWLKHRANFSLTFALVVVFSAHRVVFQIKTSPVGTFVEAWRCWLRPPFNIRLWLCLCLNSGASP